MSYLFFPVNYGNKVKQTTRYSKVGPLVITRSIETDYLMEYPYIITHAASGRSVARLSALSQARRAMALLFPLTDWTQSKEALKYDTVLARRVRSTVSDLNGHVANR